MSILESQNEIARTFPVLWLDSPTHCGNFPSVQFFYFYAQAIFKVRYRTPKKNGPSHFREDPIQSLNRRHRKRRRRQIMSLVGCTFRQEDELHAAIFFLRAFLLRSRTCAGGDARCVDALLAQEFSG
jgi:hypothetical protein